MDKIYTNYISLGYFCEVAKDLEKLGLRNFSSPFDWGISCFPNVIEAIENKFDGFMEYDNLSQSVEDRTHYHEDVFNFWFFHDFSEYKSLDKQYAKEKEKYWRRIKRFMNVIKSPTLFVRYISVEELDDKGKSKELIWIEQNYSHILNVLRTYNSGNDIIFIGDESVYSDIIHIYKVPRDKGDIVSRTPIYNNKELFPLLSDVEFPGKEKNKERYYEKERANKAIMTRVWKKLNRMFNKTFKEVYIHSKEFRE